MQTALREQVADHVRQQALRLDVGLCIVRAEKCLEIRLKLVENRGGEAPEVHGDGRVRVERARGAVRDVGDVSVGVELDLQRFLHARQLAVFHAADPARDSAVETDGVFEQIPDHRGAAALRQAAELVVHRAVGVDTVVVVGVDDAEGLVYIVARAEHGVRRAEGLRAPGGQGIKRGQTLEVLKCVADLERLSAAGGLAAQTVAAEGPDQTENLGLDDKDDLRKARADGVVDGVFHQHLTVRADAVDLLISPIARAETRRHDDKGCVHCFSSFSAVGGGYAP